MPLDLLRIDERLIHGQVLVGWGTRLGLEFYVVADDALASSPWEQDIWASALDGEALAKFLSVEEAGRRFADLDGRSESGALLTRGTAQMRALAEGGCLDGRHVNVGGLHAGSGRRKILDYIYLSEAELDDLRVIAEHASSVSARELPTAPEVSLRELAAR